jgi:hypothetical protein
MVKAVDSKYVLIPAPNKVSDMLLTTAVHLKLDKFLISREKTPIQPKTIICFFHANVSVKKR